MSREQKILAAAEKLFSERSFDGVGIDAIGKEAGIVGSGVYRHFSSKQEILARLMEGVTDALLKRLPPATDDPQVALQTLVETHVEFCLTHHRLADIWQREHHILSSELQQQFDRRQRRYIERWVDCLDSCYPDHPREDLLAAIRAMHALISSDTTRRSASPAPGDLAGLLRRLALSALDGLNQR